MRKEQIIERDNRNTDLSIALAEAAYEYCERSITCALLDGMDSQEALSDAITAWGEAEAKIIDLCRNTHNHKILDVPIVKAARRYSRVATDYYTYGKPENKQQVIEQAHNKLMEAVRRDKARRNAGMHGLSSRETGNRVLHKD